MKKLTVAVYSKQGLFLDLRLETWDFRQEIKEQREKTRLKYESRNTKYATPYHRSRAACPNIYRKLYYRSRAIVSRVHA